MWGHKAVFVQFGFVSPSVVPTFSTFSGDAMAIIMPFSVRARKIARVPIWEFRYYASLSIPMGSF